MELKHFYQKIHEITKIKHYKSFSFYFHGGILNWPEQTNDIDLKLVPRIRPLTIQEVNETMKELTVKLDIETVFFNEIYTWDSPLKPTLEEIDSTKPVLQAVYGKNLQELLDFNREVDSKYLYKGGVKYKPLMDLIFYKSSEWAVCGHKYNQNFKELSDEQKDRFMKEPTNDQSIELHTSGKLCKEISEYDNLVDIEIREMLQKHHSRDWNEFKEMYRRI